MNIPSGSSHELDTLDIQGALSTFSDAARFPFIPRSLSKYVEKCISKKQKNRLTEAVIGKRLKVFENINRMFELACKATTLNPDELLKGTDFQSCDMSPTRLDSAFAEIRTVIFLKEEGFTNIQLVPAGNKKRADIVGTLNGKFFTIEVANSIFAANNRVDPFQLKDWLVARVSSDQKLDQLQQTARAANADEKVLVGVIDTFPSVVFNTHNEYCEAARLVWNALGGKNNFRVAFVTGLEAIGYGRDDCVFPHWPNT